MAKKKLHIGSYEFVPSNHVCKLVVDSIKDEIQGKVYWEKLAHAMEIDPYFEVKGETERQFIGNKLVHNRGDEIDHKNFLIRLKKIVC